MPRFNRREQLPLHIKRTICAHHVDNHRLRHVDMARWCYSQYGLRPDRSTVGRILKSAVRWAVTATGDNQVRRRGGAWPELEQAMARWIANAGPTSVPLTLQTIRDHVATMARNMGIPPTFRCSVDWVRRALRRQGVRCRAAQGEAASADMAAVRHAREKLPQLLTHLDVTPRGTFNLDETALWLSVLPRRTYSNSRIPGRNVSKERLTVALLVNADGSLVFRPLVISKAKRPHDFRPDYDPESLCYWRHNAKGWMTSPLFTHFISQLNDAMYAEGRKIVVLLDNGSSHMLRSELALSEIVCGMQTTCMSNVRLVFLSPNTAAFTQPIDQGIIATVKARYRQHWLRAFSALWNGYGATSAVARFRLNLRDVLAWLSDAWTSVDARTIQRCWWRTGCLPLSWSLELTHVHDDEPTPAVYPDIEPDDDVDDIGTLISWLALGNAAMTTAEYVAIDDGEPTCAEGAARQPMIEPEEGVLWQAPTTMQAVYDDADPVGREARRTARAACETLIGYGRATRITPRDLCHLFDIRNPIIIVRMERASPSFNLNVAPQPVPSPGATPTPKTPRPRGHVLPGWMTRPSRRQELLDAGVGAVMDGYVDATEWMRLGQVEDVDWKVSAAELRFVLRRFPLIRTLRIRFFGPTVLPGAPREQRAEDRHHKRPGGGRLRAGGVTGAGDGGTEAAGGGTRAGGGGTGAATTRGGETPHQPQAAAVAASAPPAPSSPPAPVPAFPISDADVLDGSAIVRLLSLNTPLQIQQVAGTQVEYLSICNCGEFEVHQGLRTYMCDTITAWGRSIRHIEMHDPMPSADEFWKCVEGHPMLSKVTVYNCTHLTDGFLRHVAKCDALKELSIASCPNVSGGGFAELAVTCPGLEGMVLEDLSLSVVAKKARSTPGGGRVGGGGAGEGAGGREGEGRAEGRVGLDGIAAEGEAEWIRGGEGERVGGGAGEDVRMGEGGGEAERGVGGMEGGDGLEGARAAEGAGRPDGLDGTVSVSGEAETAEVQAAAEGTVAATAAAGRGGNLAASFPNLSSLKIINCTLDAHWLEMFAGQLPALRRLTVMACPDPLDRFFLTAARTAARLESVEIVDCEGVSDRGIVALLKGCPTINSLTLSGCEGGRGGGGEGGGTEGRREGRGGEGRGRRGEGGEGNAASVTDESLRAVVVHGVGLRSLQLKWSPGFSGLQLARDVLGCSLSLLSPPASRAASFVPISTAGPGAPVLLPPRGVDPHGLQSDVLQTHVLQLHASHTLQSHRLQSHVLPLLQLGWSGLEFLHLEGLDGLSDSFLLLAAATCPHLSTLAVEYCREISEAGLIPLVQSCHRLQHMCFSGFRATHLSDLLLHTIASHCPLLSTLSLRACNGVTTHGVVRVLQGCGRIERCQLARCQEVDEEWVVRVAREVGEVRARGAGGSSRGAGEMPVIEIS
ncbi:unnamed protein product [Closterium sp. NIES-65]|nr:unnamed protein product [Closterium sp. NIES-65]CAI6010120.1 unnamed protein product [Closterium sp. NIES-65]